MYNQYLKLETSKNNVKGVFTSITIPEGIPIIEFTGTLYIEKDLPNPNDPYILQVGPNTFLGPSGDIDDHINHSCNPNCILHVVGNRAILYSLYNVPAGTEITFDYSTSSTDTHDKWNMKCNCGFVSCRKIISGYQYLEPTLKEEYKKKGMVPLFLTESIFMKK